MKEINNKSKHGIEFEIEFNKTLKEDLNRPDIIAILESHASKLFKIIHEFHTEKELNEKTN